MEFALKNPNSKIIYYSKDNAFGEFLLKEFTENIADSSLFICDNEIEVKKQLEKWAKEIDEYSYQPIEDFDENEGIINWLNSNDFSSQIIERNFGLVEKGRLIVSSSAHLISVDSIENLTSNDDSNKFYVEIVLQIKYELKDGGKTSEIFNVGIRVEAFDDNVYSIEDAYRMDTDDE